MILPQKDLKNMIQTIIKKIHKKDAEKKVKTIIKYLANNEKILDFGSGDLSFAVELKRRLPSLTITGVDVVEFKSIAKDMKFIKYNGVNLPFKDNTFDTVISLYVFHHCQNAEESFRECMRVSKKRVIFIEAVARNKFEIPFMKLIDWVTNAWKTEKIPLPFQFHTLNEWHTIFKKNNFNLVHSEVLNTFSTSILPVSEPLLFEVSKKNHEEIT